MYPKTKHTVKELEKYIHMYLNEGISHKKLYNHHGLLLGETNFYFKVMKYQIHGVKGIEPNQRTRFYSRTFKLSLITEYLNSDMSLRQLAANYNLTSPQTAQRWINKYTKGEEIKEFNPNPEVYTMKIQQTTYHERLEIVQSYLNNNLSYKKTAEKFHVNYQNVYSWVHKYKEHGPDGLIDGRGKGKPTSIQTNEEKQRAQIAALKARNEFLETENAALKKLHEMERELMSRKRGTKQNSKPSKRYRKKDSK